MTTLMSNHCPTAVESPLTLSGVVLTLTLDLGSVRAACSSDTVVSQIGGGGFTSF